MLNDLFFALAMFAIFYGVWLIFKAATRDAGATRAQPSPQEVEVQVVMPSSIRPSVKRVRRKSNASAIRLV